MKAVKINGVNIYPFVSADELITFIDNKKSILVAINAGKINRATDETREIINNGIGYADGRGAQYALHKHGFPDAVIIPGCELWLSIIKKYYKTDKTFYFVGGKQEVIEKTIEKLRLDYPGINILGFRNGYLTKDDEDTLVKDVAEKRPDFVFVAMGSPKQELLMYKLQQSHRALYQGLGGSFDIYVGNLKRAPEWLRKRGLEGPYRVISDFNKARFKRFVNDFSFMVKVFFNKI